MSVCKKKRGTENQRKQTIYPACQICFTSACLGYLGWAEAVAVGHIAGVLFLLIGHEAAVASVHLWITI